MFRVLALVLLVTLGACGDDDEAAETSTTTATTSTTRGASGLIVNHGLLFGQSISGADAQAMCFDIDQANLSIQQGDTSEASAEIAGSTEIPPQAADVILEDPARNVPTAAAVCVDAGLAMLSER